MKSTLNSRFILLLIISSVILMGDTNSGSSRVVMACPQYCLDTAYVTCPSSGDQQLPARCNCCMTPKGCTLHFPDGTFQNC
ncbi:hypothetical protein vseg_011052 [Gypsophila vaccaria]